MGLAKFFLGVEIVQAAIGISLSQSKYIIDMLKDSGLQDANIASSPLPSGFTIHDSSQ